jgi:RHS repeat-associated protein
LLHPPSGAFLSLLHPSRACDRDEKRSIGCPCIHRPCLLLLIHASLRPRTAVRAALLSCTGTATTGNTLDLKYDFGWSVADNGNVNGITNNRDTTRSQSFTYDQVNRIATAETSSTSGSHCWGEKFTYDQWANLLSIGVASTSYNGCTQESLNVMPTASNQLPSSLGYMYDLAGNLTTVPPPASASYTYNAESQMTSAQGVTYTYDGDGKRVQKSNGKLYWYGVGSDPIAESDVSGNITDEYVFFDGKRVAHRKSSGEVDYYFADHLGTSRIVTNATGTILDDSDFYPFGGERVITSSSGNTYKFTGKERDSESGLDNFGARYNASSMGRFMTPDPIHVMKQKLVDPQQWNMYSYVRNSPLRLVDPTGMYATNCGSLGAKACANRVKQIDAFQAKLAASTNKQDQAIAKTLGTSKDTKNGVTIGFVEGFKNSEGKALPDKNGNTSGLFAAGQATPDGKPVADIHIDLKGSLSGSDLSAAVEHEGEHATERMGFVNSCSATGCSQSLNLTGRQSEQNAYGAEYRFWQSVGQEQQHPAISSPDHINQFLNQHPDAYPKSYLDNLLFPSDL